MAGNKSFFVVASVIGLMLIWGSARPLLAKIIMQMDFDKPIFIAMATFAGMGMALLLNMIPAMRRYEEGLSAHKGETQADREKKQAKETTEKKDDRAHFTNWVLSQPTWIRPAIPSLFDMTASVIYFIVLGLMPASVLEILRNGLELVFSTLLSIKMRSRRVSYWKWSGIVVTCIGMTVVGYADIIDAPDGRSEAASRMLLGLLGLVVQCVLGALQDISEEIVMQDGHKSSGSYLLGMEGCYEFVMAFILVVPISILVHTSNGEPLENWGDSFTLLSGSKALVFTIFAYMIMVLLGNLWNIFAIELTSAMARNLWKSFRSIIVWAVELIIYYFISEKVGDAWHPHSYLKLIGLALCLIGVQCFYRPEVKKQGRKQAEPEETELLLPQNGVADTYQSTADSSDLP